MLKYTLMMMGILIPSMFAFAEEGARIGSIDDSGRVDSETFEFSNTENKLWMDKHLHNIKQPARLHYEFEKTGSYEEGFIDDVYLDVVKINNDGTRDTVLEFFTAERKQLVSPDTVTHVSGNPVIGKYLTGDTYEMNRLTGGNWKYFLRELKLAMADNNESEIVTVRLSDEQHKAEKITLLPFESENNKLRLKEFSDKRYEFILSDEIPGKLYQIRTVINDAKNPDEPLIEEVLTLKSVVFNSL